MATAGRTIINLVSVDDDDLRRSFVDYFDSVVEAVIRRRVFPNGVITPRTVFVGGEHKLSIFEYDYSEFKIENDGIMTVFVFSGDRVADNRHVRMAAAADYTVELSGINPGGLRGKRYLNASLNDIEGVWQHLLGGISSQVCTPAGSSAESGAPAVGHWG